MSTSQVKLTTLRLQAVGLAKSLKPESVLVSHSHPCTDAVTESQSRGMLGHLVLDSDLDAFSQYPSLGSFTTPAAQLIVETREVA